MYDVTVDEQARLIVVKGTGRGTTEEALQLIADQQQRFARYRGYDFLYDSSELDIVSSPADMIRVAEALFADGRLRFRKFAIVVPPERAHLARIFTALAHPYDIDANVFTDSADAHAWLGLPG